MDDVRTITARNREAWNGVAEARRANCAPPEFFAAGGSTLDPEETAALGDVAGLRVLNLQCSSGNEALSLAAMGATVTGLDISEVAIDIAREQAVGAGLAVRFVAADVYDLPADLTGFDLVYSSAGIICWLPDLAAWARIVAGTLRPGGRFVLDEHHPLWEVVSQRDGRLQVDRDYFGRSEPSPAGPADPARTVRAGRRALSMNATTFTWPVGDVVTALVRAGLGIDELTERPDAEMYPEAGASARRLPAAYLLVATKR